MMSLRERLRQAGAAAAAALGSTLAPRWGQRARRHRLEAFGAIFQLTRPRALVFTDRAYARDALKLAQEPPQWRGSEPDLGDQVLSAPLEAHLQLTNRCTAGCRGCYTGASPEGAPSEWGLVEWKRALDELARLGVFHVALGGGESAVLPWLGELAEHAQALGIVPNLTTSGLAGLEELLPICHHFGQINVSLDGVGEVYRAVRGFDGFAAADSAIRRLRERKREIGINVVVTRANFEHLDAVFAYARQRRLSEVELLRYKPAGRGARAYDELRCTDAQHRAFLPLLSRAARRHRLRLKVDCSYTPMLAHHQVEPALLGQLVVYGCTGGDFLIGAKPSGLVTACSFAAPPASAARPRVDRLGEYWSSPEAFSPFRQWRAAAEPCQSCRYLSLCRGGCRVVAAHRGEASDPDPECPRVVDFRRTQAAAEPDAAGAGRRRLPVI